MQIANNEKHIISNFGARDPLGRYYTKEAISNHLIAEIDLKNPSKIMDLGCGAGSLSLSAAGRWSDATFITVDKNTEPYSLAFFLKDGKRYSHHFSDVLSDSFFQEIGVIPGTLDIVLCNPPFISNNEKFRLTNVFEKIGLQFTEKELSTLPVELLFISQGLLALKDGGRLALIVPDGIISGSRYSYFRRTLLQSHGVKSVIKLPQKMFHGTEAQAHIMIITKNSKVDNRIALKTFPANEDTIYINPEQAIRSLDYSYHHFNAKASKVGKTMRDLGVKISRGKVSSKKAKLNPGVFFHIDNFVANEKYINLECSVEPDEENIFLQKGDIAISRVGRNFTKKIALIEGGCMPITDCVFKIEVRSDIREHIFKYLTSEHGRLALSALSCGVSAKHISMQSLYELIIPNRIENV